MATVTTSENTAANGHYGSPGRSPWLDTGWHEHQRWLTIGSRHANVIDVGSGQPLVFVHGLSGCWQAWLENIPAFAERYRVIVPDLPGFGLSEMPAEQITIEGYAQFLSDMFSELEIERAHIIANSMGGHIVSVLATSRPDLVEKLVLISPAGVFTYGIHRSPLVMFGRSLQQLADRLMSDPATVVRRKNLRKFAMGIVVRYPDRLDPELCWEILNGGGGKPGFRDALDAILSHDVRPHLSEITAPTLVMWGEHDKLIPARDAHAFADAITNSELSIYQDTGHVPYIERPARFNAEVMEFLD